MLDIAETGIFRDDASHFFLRNWISRYHESGSAKKGRLLADTDLLKGKIFSSIEILLTTYSFGATPLISPSATIIRIIRTCFESARNLEEQVSHNSTHQGFLRTNFFRQPVCRNTSRLWYLLESTYSHDETQRVGCSTLVPVNSCLSMEVVRLTTNVLNTTKEGMVSVLKFSNKVFRIMESLNSC